MNFRTRFREAAGSTDPVDPMPHELANPDLAPPTIRETIQQAIRSELSIIAEDRGLESFQDADDFTEDDPEVDPLTIYEQALLVPENDETLDGTPFESSSASPDAANSPPVVPEGTPEPKSAPEATPGLDLPPARQ